MWSAPLIPEVLAADTPLDAVPFAVVDVETTGTRGDGSDRLTEIAIVPVRGGEVGTGYSQLVDPGRPIPWYIAMLTGIDDAMVRGQPPFHAVAPLVRSQLDGRVFVAHNAAFDWRFVSSECGWAGVPVEVPHRLCTVRLTRRLVPSLPRRSLDHLATHFGLTNDARHRALGDATITAHALVRLLTIAQSEGAQTWGQLQSVLAPRRARERPIPGEVGKHDTE
jgi:DNA polymerase III subunit epsilon